MEIYIYTACEKKTTPHTHKNRIIENLMLYYIRIQWEFEKHYFTSFSLCIYFQMK